MKQQGAAEQHQFPPGDCNHQAMCTPGNREKLTVFCRKDFLVCDQFLTKTHYEVDILWSSALRLLPPLVIPVVYSKDRKTKNKCQSLLSRTTCKITFKTCHWGAGCYYTITVLINDNECLLKNTWGWFKQEENQRQIQGQHLVLFPHSGKTHTPNDVSLSDRHGSQWNSQVTL